MRITITATVAFALGLTLAACEDGSGYTCKIEYIAETGGDPVETEEKDFGEFPTPLDAVEACDEYAMGRINEVRKAFTCTCVDK